MATIQTRFTTDGAARYRVRYRVDGAQKVTTFAVLKHAEKWLALLEAAGPEAALTALKTPASVTVPTITEHVTDHIDHLTGIQDGTRSDYRVMLDKHITPHLGSLPVTLVDRAAGARWLNALEKAGLSGKTIRNVHSLLSAALTSAARNKIIGENPIKGLRLPVTVREQEITFLTRDEYQRLLGHVPAYWQPLVQLLAETGMRWGEATALTVADVDLDRRTIRIRQAWKRTGSSTPKLGTTKGRQSRTIAMPKRCADFLAARSKVAAPGDFVFINTKGGPVRHTSFRTNVWVDAVASFAGDTQTGKHKTTRRTTWDGKGTGKRPRIHDLRHSFASWAIAAGLSLTAIQRHLGHQSIKTTSDTYGHIFRADLDAFAQIIPEAIEPAASPGIGT